jgi:methionyl-tRNA formyltransferase
MSAAVLERLVRALGPPYPGAVFLIGSEQIRIVGAEVVRGPLDVEPGRVLIVSGDNATIMTGDGALRIRAERTLDGLLTEGDAL